METGEIENSSTSSIGKKKSKKKNNKAKLNQNINNKMLDLGVISQNLEERLHIKQNGLIVNGERHSSDEEIVDRTNLVRTTTTTSTTTTTTIISSANNINEKIKNNNFPIETDEHVLDKFSLKNNIDKVDKLKMNDKIGSNKIDVIDKNGCSSNEIGCDDLNDKQLVVAPIPIVITDESSSLNILKSATSSSSTTSSPIIEYKEYESELQMPDIMRLIQKDLSEPYSIYTYRYFIHNWPKLCFLAMHKNICVGAIVCKLDMHRSVNRGYIAMLAVDKDFRKLKIGSNLVQKAIQAMLNDNADEVVLETEITNIPALRLYENLGFVRDKRLFHYYLNGVDALRLKLWFR